MDGSESKAAGRTLGVLACALLILLICDGSFLRAAYGATPPPVKKAVSYAGIFYGTIVDVQKDRSAITVRPFEHEQARKRFYLDKTTLISVDGKHAGAKDVFFGDKVAVRYFASGLVALADAVYVVFGEFQPKNYVVKKKVVLLAKPGEKGGAEAPKKGEAPKKAEPAKKAAE